MSIEFSRDSTPPVRERVDTKDKRDYKRLQRAQVALPVWPAHQSRHSPEETSVPGLIVV